MIRPGIVQLDKLMEEVRMAVGEGREGGALLGTNAPKFVVMKDPGIVGFIVSIDELRGKDIAEVTAVADRIGAAMGGPGGIVLNGGNIVVGFLPPAGVLKE